MEEFSHGIGKPPLLSHGRGEIRSAIPAGNAAFVRRLAPILMLRRRSYGRRTSTCRTVRMLFSRNSGPKRKRARIKDGTNGSRYEENDGIET